MTRRIHAAVAAGLALAHLALAAPALAADQTPLKYSAAGPGGSNVVAGMASGDTVGAPHGGTGVASPTAHCLTLAEGAAAMHVVCPASAGQVFGDNGASSDPSFQALAITLSMPATFSCAGSPVTTLSGGFSCGYATESANTVLAGPSSGGAAAPAFRALALADLPQLGANKVLGNFTGSSAAPAANAVPSCSGSNQALNYTSGTGLGCISVGPGSGGGLFGPILGTPPTSSSTGYTTWVNQGSTATVADTPIGVTMFDGTAGGASSLRVRIKTAPATPYTATYFLAFNAQVASPYSGMAVGWYNGSNKLEVIFVQWQNTATVEIGVGRYSDPNTFSATDFGPVVGLGTQYVFLRLKDNGTTVYFQYSEDGQNFWTAYSVAKSSGYLGSSGYSDLALICEAQGAPCGLTLMNYTETSP